MPSEISWTVLNDADLAEAKAIINHLSLDSTVDVLRLGIPLETISEIFFPGTSTLHTRLRYVLFVPSILYHMHTKSGDFDPEAELKKHETALIKALINGGEKNGVLGSSAGEKLKYRPSMTYWTSFNRYHVFGKVERSKKFVLERINRKLEKSRKVEDGESIDAQTEKLEFDEPFLELMAMKKDGNGVGSLIQNGKMVKQTQFTLTREEAKFFKNKINQNSLCFYLLKKPISEIEAASEVFELKTKNTLLAELLTAAKDYSQISKGISLAYNWVLCLSKSRNLKNYWKESAEIHKKNFEVWLKRSRRLKNWEFESLQLALDNYKNSKFFETVGSTPRVNEPLLFEDLKGFVAGCQKLMFADALKKEDLLEQISNREEEVKSRNGSRFRNHEIVIPEPIEYPQENETYPYLYNYRWAQGKRNIIDIKKALGD